MKLEDVSVPIQPLPGALRAWEARAGAAQWWSLCHAAQQTGARLVSLWGADRSDLDQGYTISAALETESGLLIATAALAGERPAYPSVANVFPWAARLQRSIWDMLGLRAHGAEDTRRWLRHGAWPEGWHPLRKSSAADAAFAPQADAYPFIAVEGEGVHEIAVGPVHAGIIEPGHFRFSVVGERILRLEERLGYKHKGIEKRFEGMGLLEGAKLAGRVSGDSTVAYAWSYAMAAESVCGFVPPPRAGWLRALLLERERIANHLGDLGYLGNDAALAFGLSQFSLLKEDMLRANADLFGHRYLMDVVVPGGVARDVDAAGAARIRAEIDRLTDIVPRLRRIYDEHAGLQDRFMTTGVVSSQLANELGLVGVAARASGHAVDTRARFAPHPYDQLQPRVCVEQSGDVAARVAVRFAEIAESLRLCREILERLPSGVSFVPPAGGPVSERLGVGAAEGWRGQVFVALECDPDGRLRRCHALDPSWQNWPALEHAVLGNIVPDFPLINKSFNLSYSGVDL